MKLIAYMFQFYDEHPNNPVIENVDGTVWYEFEAGAGYANQLFSRKGLFQTSTKVNVWTWDGNKEEPTITPSFLLPDFRLHLYVRKGKLDILPDTTVDCSDYKRLKWEEFFKVEDMKVN